MPTDQPSVGTFDPVANPFHPSWRARSTWAIPFCSHKRLQESIADIRAVVGAMFVVNLLTAARTRSAAVSISEGIRLNSP